MLLLYSILLVLTVVRGAITNISFVHGNVTFVSQTSSDEIFFLSYSDRMGVLHNISDLLQPFSKVNGVRIPAGYDMKFSVHQYDGQLACNLGYFGLNHGDTDFSALIFLFENPKSNSYECRHVLETSFNDKSVLVVLDARTDSNDRTTLYEGNEELVQITDLNGIFSFSSGSAKDFSEKFHGSMLCIDQSNQSCCRLSSRLTKLGEVQWFIFADAGVCIDPPNNVAEDGVRLGKPT